MQYRFVALLVALLSIHVSYAQLTSVEREEILRAHNHVRSLVSPPAADMRRMVSFLCWPSVTMCF